MLPKISRTLMKLMDFNGAGHKDAAPSVVEKFAADKARLLSSRDVRAARIKREQADQNSSSTASNEGDNSLKVLQSTPRTVDKSIKEGSDVSPSSSSRKNARRSLRLSKIKEEKDTIILKRLSLKGSTATGRKMAVADKYPYLIFDRQNKTYVECCIEYRDSRFSNHYYCYGPSEKYGGEWEDVCEASLFLLKDGSTFDPALFFTTKKRSKMEEKRRASSYGHGVKRKRSTGRPLRSCKRKKKYIARPSKIKEKIIVQYTKYLYRRMFIWCVQHPKSALENIVYADGTTHKSLEDVVKKFSAQKIPVNYLLSGAKSG